MGEVIILCSISEVHLWSRYSWYLIIRASVSIVITPFFEGAGGSLAKAPPVTKPLGKGGVNVPSFVCVVTGLGRFFLFYACALCTYER